MPEIKRISSSDTLKKATQILKNDWYYFLWEFLREIDKNNDELILVFSLDWKKLILVYLHSNQKELPKISDIFYAAYFFEMKFMIFIENQQNEQKIIF